jgi:RNA polymerase sigma factor (sigma-70 family)
MASALPRTGDDYAALDRRYRRALTRYARSLLRRSHHDAEDVVQDVLIRAHAALQEGRGPEDLRPWLFRLTRNRAIDEVRRARWGDEALDESGADRRWEPEVVLRRKETMRALVEDLADLPVGQRTALVAREVDGLTAQETAETLGVSVPAAQMLAARARANLVKARAARDAECLEIRDALADARERGVRAREHVQRHLRGCSACRGYERGLRRVSRRLHSLMPPGLLGPAAALAKLLGGGTTKLVAGVAAAVVLAAGGGVVVLGSQLFESGRPAPFQLKGIAALTGSSVRRGGLVPAGTAVVTVRVRLPAGAPAAGADRTVALSCPTGMRVAGLQAPEQRLPLSYGLSKSTILGSSAKATIVFDDASLARSYDATVGILCRKLAANGSMTANPRPLRPGERAGKICAARSYIDRKPGRTVVGTVFRGEPVAIRRTSGTWVRIVPDLGMTGWVRASALCP